MKPLNFWIKQFFVIFLLVTVCLLGVYLLRGRPVTSAASEAVLWAAISAGVAVATQIVRLRRGEKCAMCEDSPAN